MSIPAAQSLAWHSLLTGRAAMLEMRAGTQALEERLKVVWGPAFVRTAERPVKATGVRGPKHQRNGSAGFGDAAAPRGHALEIVRGLAAAERSLAEGEVELSVDSGQAEESVHDITTRALTAEEREHARVTWLEAINSASPFGELGCYVAYTAAWGAVSFGGGFLIGLLAAVATGRAGDWWWFGVGIGVVGAAISAAVTIPGHLIMAMESWWQARRLAADAEDFGDVVVIRCQSEAAARCSHEKLIDGPVYALSVGDGLLLVLRGAYVEDLCEEEGFPHESFKIEVNLRALVLNYEPGGKRLVPQSIDYDAYDERERAALDKIPDQALLCGTMETCVADMVRHLAP